MASIQGILSGGLGGTKEKVKNEEEASGSDKVSQKKMKLAKFGLKFQSAGTLISIGDNRIEKDTPLCQDATPILKEREEEGRAQVTRRDGRQVKIGGVVIDVGKKASYTSLWEKAGEGAKKANAAPLPSSLDQAPPPLMSRQRELIMEKAADRENSDDEETDFTAKIIVKKPATFKFKIGK